MYMYIWGDIYIYIYMKILKKTPHYKPLVFKHTCTYLILKYILMYIDIFNY